MNWNEPRNYCWGIPSSPRSTAGALGDVDFLINEASKPQAYRFWKVAPPEGQSEVVLAHYTDGKGTPGLPALLARTVDAGRVLLFTTPFDRHKLAGDREGRETNNYFEMSSFGFVLANLGVGYLAGDTEEVNPNYQAGQQIPVTLPPRKRYTLVGPGITGSDADLSPLSDQKDLRITQAIVPGNFWILDEKTGQHLADFSTMPYPDECQLDRVPVEQIEAVLGQGSVVPVAQGQSAQIHEGSLGPAGGGSPCAAGASTADPGPGESAGQQVLQAARGKDGFGESAAESARTRSGGGGERHQGIDRGLSEPGA